MKMLNVAEVLLGLHIVWDKKTVILKIFLSEVWNKGKILRLNTLQGLVFTEFPESFIESYEVNRNGLGRMTEISMQSL